MTGTVLLVDDEPSMRMLTRLLLEERGLDCDEAPGGLEALDRCAHDAYAAIVLDHRMPGTTGIEVATLLRERGDATPIVIYTGWSASETADQAELLGIPVISKSETEQLVDHVAGLVLN